MYCKILNRLKPIFMVFATFVLLFVCNDSDKTEEEIANIPLDLKISRFDREFDAAGEYWLPALRRM